MQNQKSALGLDGNITAAIGYPIGIIALILIFIEKDNKFVRFHALQSILWAVFGTVSFIAIMIIGIVLGLILSAVSSTLGGIVWGLTALLYVVALLGFFGGIIFAAIKSYGGEEFRLPIVGNLAQKWV